MKKKTSDSLSNQDSSRGQVRLSFIAVDMKMTKMRTEEFPAAPQPGESLANAFGTCHCRTADTQTKAMARAKSFNETQKILIE